MSEPLNVLLVEDSATDAKLVVHELKRLGRPVAFERVETAEAMRSALVGKTWDLVLSDWSMPSFSAPAALAILNESRVDVPFIIVSGTVGEESAVEAMRAGAKDYVLKDRLGRLIPVVERELLEHRERVARRTAEAALVRSEERFQRLAESGIIGIVTADLDDGTVLDANDAYLTMVGYSREELRQGRVRWADLIPSEAAPWVERANEQLRRGGVAPPFESHSLRKDGTRIPVLAGAAMLDPPIFIAFIADLTALRRAEAGKALAEAGRARAEDALQRSEDQLRQAQKMEAVGRLAGGVAHDFNNVLSVILSYGEVILNDLLPADPLREDIEEIRKAATRAARLTRQLLTFSRQRVVQPKVLVLEEVVRGLERMLRRIVGEDVDLVVASSSSRGRVRVDPGHIEQVVLNLVVNARDAMPTGGQLTIETCDVELDEAYVQDHLTSKVGPHVMLAVTDTGCGMDRATRERIFEPFFTTKEVGKGTGLGLSTVFGIVQQSHGSIWVYSEPGKGTTFKIYLPLVEDGVDAPRRTAAPSSLQGSETVLLVEDEEQVRTILHSILRRQGYEVLVAADGKEAIDVSARHQGAIALLLTDVVMPRMSGPEVAKQLAAERPGIKVVFMSGYTHDSIVRHGVLDANVAFLQKPLTPALVATRIREVLDDTQNERDGTTLSE